jgi:hypothetical protein
MLMDRLAAESPVEFSRLFGNATRRVEIIVTFLALLELLRRRLATTRQSEAMGSISLSRGGAGRRGAGFDQAHGRRAGRPTGVSLEMSAGTLCGVRAGRRSG